MEYVYSAMVLHAAGKEINENAIASVLKAAGVEPDTSRIKALTAALDGVDIEDAISKAVAAPVAAAPAGGAAAAAPAAEKAPEKKEEEEKVSEEEAAAGLGALFG
ncbi:MAG: 50S ribosomal protein P1 [Candidatus Thermoplasmatota archaeon]|nr:50S ribosomal protein P1 [Candidatus Thermoplasmatota archaeon]